MALSQRSAALLHGWRSGLEEEIAGDLDAVGVLYEYEKLVIPFAQPMKPRKYTPDFLLLRNGIIVESKGLFQTADRQKHLMVKAQHPNLDIRFVFSNPNTRISKQSATTYALWCTSKGFKFAKVSIPDEWLEETPNGLSLAAIERLRKCGR